MKNKLIKIENEIYRILSKNENKICVINCNNLNMPKWIELKKYIEITEEDLKSSFNISFIEEELINQKSKAIMYQRYTLIAGILPFAENKYLRTRLIRKISEENKISIQTIKKYLWLYLVFQDKRILLPTEKKEKKINKDEKNMRWALNKYYYNKNKNSIKYTYVMMLKEKYCDEKGNLLEKYPSFYQFRYFYRKTKRLETYYISRDGIKSYQRDNRPLLGDNIQTFAPNIGIGMLDSTLCDIYLINEEGQIIGRPILTTCIDAYSGLCCGYALTIEGGVYSLEKLLTNIISNKKEHCKKYGIEISEKEWPSQLMPGKLITDKGAEYESNLFEQITDLGISIVNLPAYRPELKGAVEKFFDIIQNYYKPHFKGKGIIEPDYQERDAHDYRKDASLTMFQFEQIIIRCILFYNTKRIIEKFPYTQEMLEKEIKPYSNEIWNYAINLPGINLIKVTKEEIELSLLPRIKGKFTRFGLKANGLRYDNEKYKEEYLKGEEVLIAYNPNNVSFIYLIKDGKYIKFKLIENRFKEKTLEEVAQLKLKQFNITKKEKENKIQSEITLSEHLLAIRNQTNTNNNSNIKSIADNRKNEKRRIKEGE